MNSISTDPVCAFSHDGESSEVACRALHAQQMALSEENPGSEERSTWKKLLIAAAVVGLSLTGIGWLLRRNSIHSTEEGAAQSSSEQAPLPTEVVPNSHLPQPNNPNEALSNSDSSVPGSEASASTPSPRTIGASIREERVQDSEIRLEKAYDELLGKKNPEDFIVRLIDSRVQDYAQVLFKLGTSDRKKLFLYALSAALDECSRRGLGWEELMEHEKLGLISQHIYGVMDERAVVESRKAQDQRVTAHHRPKKITHPGG